MRALSIWQPDASLIALGLKRFETRSWRVGYTGELAIHAAKSRDGLTWLRSDAPDAVTIRRALVELRGNSAVSDLPLGAVVCVTRALGTVPVEAIRDDLPPLELAAGDFSDGRFAIELEVVELLTPPVSHRGPLTYAWPTGTPRPPTAAARGYEGLWDWKREG